VSFVRFSLVISVLALIISFGVGKSSAALFNLPTLSKTVSYGLTKGSSCRSELSTPQGQVASAISVALKAPIMPLIAMPIGLDNAAAKLTTIT